MAAKEYEIKTFSLITADKRGNRKMAELLNDGWEIVTQTKTAFSRATQYTMRRPNPKYKGPRSESLRRAWRQTSGVRASLSR